MVLSSTSGPFKLLSGHASYLRHADPLFKHQKRTKTSLVVWTPSRRLGGHKGEVDHVVWTLCGHTMASGLSGPTTEVC